MFEHQRPLTFVPSPLPDQTLYSWVWMYHEMSGNASVDISARQVFRSAGGKFHFHIPSHLDGFCASTRRAFGEPTDIVQKMTVLPAHLWFRPQSLYQDVLEKLRSPLVTGIPQALRLWEQGEYPSLPARSCPQCAREDKEWHGFAYWHRKHQLPGVVVCSTHSAPLYTLTLQQAQNRTRLISPEGAIKFGNREEMGPKQSIDALVELSKISEVLVEPGAREVNWARNLRKACICAMENRGFLPEGKPMDPTQSVSAFEKTLREWYCLPELEGTTARAADLLWRLIMRSGGHQRAEDYVVLLGGLFHTANHFIQATGLPAGSSGEVEQ